MDWQKVLLDLVKGSWKTTTVGFISAICILIIPSLQAGQMPTTPQWILAVALAFLGTVAKDGNKNGTEQFGDPVRGTPGPPSISQVLGTPEPERKGPEETRDGFPYKE